MLHGFLHDTLGERDRARRRRPRARIPRPRVRRAARASNLLDADQHGATREEADALAAPLPALSPRGLYWAATRASLRFGGLLADGVRLGHATGFDSGSTLDYIYRNQANGRTPLGRLIDRTYLDAIGWRGIRQRKLDVEALLREAIARLRAPVRRCTSSTSPPATAATCSMPSPPCRTGPTRSCCATTARSTSSRATALIREKGLAGIARFEHGDAFDRASLAALAPRPTLGVVSGLYELMPDNAPGAPVARRPCRRHRARRLPRLHGPAVASAARADRARADQPSQGAAWVMRRRTQEEMDQLVARPASARWRSASANPASSPCRSRSAWPR